LVESRGRQKLETVELKRRLDELSVELAEAAKLQNPRNIMFKISRELMKLAEEE
jgi:hypothetical protein